MAGHYKIYHAPRLLPTKRVVKELGPGCMLLDRHVCGEDGGSNFFVFAESKQQIENLITRIMEVTDSYPQGFHPKKLRVQELNDPYERPKRCSLVISIAVFSPDSRQRALGTEILETIKNYCVRKIAFEHDLDKNAACFKKWHHLPNSKKNIDTILVELPNERVAMAVSNYMNPMFDAERVSLPYRGETLEFNLSSQQQPEKSKWYTQGSQKQPMRGRAPGNSHRTMNSYYYSNSYDYSNSYYSSSHPWSYTPSYCSNSYDSSNSYHSSNHPCSYTPYSYYYYYRCSGPREHQRAPPAAPQTRLVSEPNAAVPASSFAANHSTASVHYLPQGPVAHCVEYSPYAMASHQHSWMRHDPYSIQECQKGVEAKTTRKAAAPSSSARYPTGHGVQNKSEAACEERSFLR